MVDDDTEIRKLGAILNVGSSPRRARIYLFLKDMRLMFCILIFCQVLYACNGDDPIVDSPLPKLTLQQLTVEEGDETRPIFVDVRLDRPSVEVVSLTLLSEDGTAQAGLDFQAVQNVVVQFQPGTVVVPFRIEILGDEISEEDEDFTIRITQVKGAEVQTAEAVVTLLNDDAMSGYSTPESYPGMDLIWQDEFDGAALNAENWTHEIGGSGWGNNELEYYRPENTFFEDGNLVIEARKESFGGRSYTSSRIVTRNKFDFKYGRVDIRAVLPSGQGIWPALWMLGSNIGSVGWPACGEIDIMEMIGGPSRDNTVHGTAHWSDADAQHASSGDSRSLSSGIFNDQFHVFSIVWSAGSIKWYLDDVLYNTLSTTPGDMSEFRNNHFFIFNVAVGGNWPGAPNAQTVFPQKMIVDYIRVFQDQ